MRKINKTDYVFSDITCILEDDDVYSGEHDDLVHLFEDFDKRSMLPEVWDEIELLGENLEEKKIYRVTGIRYGFGCSRKYGVNSYDIQVILKAVE